jgi:4'-phosphopantetheinyl transferase
MRPDEVLVRWMEVGDVAPATLACWRGWLHPDEIARADRFRFDSDRVAYVGAHALVRSLLASVGPYAAVEWRFVIDQRGKPEIDPTLGSPLRCNLSHSRGLVAAAVSHRHDIGVDVERSDRAPLFGNIARRYFTPDEVALLRADAADGGRDAFFRLWTLKEAFIKATGEGLRRSLQSFAFALDPIAVTFPAGTPAGGEPGRWQFFQARPTETHVVATAVRRRDGPEVSFVAAAVAPDDLAGWRGEGLGRR